MKYKITTYDDYLNLSLADDEKISEQDFDLYSDTEIAIITTYIEQFRSDLAKILSDEQYKIVIENSFNMLTDDQFYNWSHREILKYFIGDYHA